MGLLRLGGIASGLDTESLIQQLMALERQPITRAEQRKQDLQTERDVWKDILTRLNNLQNTIAALKAGEAGFTTGKATTSDETILKATGGAGTVPGTYNVTVTDLASAHSLKSALFSSTDALNISGSFKISITPEGSSALEATVELTGSETLAQIQSKINDARTADGKRLPITATIVQVDSSSAHLVLTANYTGASSQITLTDVSGTPLTSLNFTQTQAAADARIDVNGITNISRSSNTISDVIPGVTLELLKGGGATATVTVARDVEKAVSTVKAFVDQYNSLVEFIGEKSAYDEKNRKAGPLLGDSTASQILNRLRRNTLDPVYTLPDTHRQAAQLGLAGAAFDADSTASLRKLELDQSTLRAKLEENPQLVADFFDAVAQRLSESIEGYVDSNGILSEKDKAFESQIDRISDQVEALERRMELRERNLRRQFEALEKTMQRLQNQQAQMLAQLSNLTGSTF